MSVAADQDDDEAFPFFGMDFESLREPSACMFYCDSCRKMFTISALKQAQSAKGYKHSNSLRELGERAKSGPSGVACYLCEMIISEGDSDTWMLEKRSVVFFLALKRKEHRLDNVDSDLQIFDGIVGYLFDEGKQSISTSALVRFLVVADDGTSRIDDFAWLA